MPTLDQRIDTLEEKLKVLKARQARRESRRRARDKEQLRRDDTRRKILVGALLLARVEQGRFRKDELFAWLDAALTRDEDRQLFGLSTTTSAAEAAASTPRDGAG